MIPVITLDGHGGAGKGAAGRLLASRLGFAHMDTGFYYRWTALLCIRDAIPPEDERRVINRAKLVVQKAESGFWPNWEDMAEIRTHETALVAASVGRIAEVRNTLIGHFKAQAQEPGLVVDGRDQGTLVFPDAIAKFLVTADPDERAKRLGVSREAQDARDDLLPPIKAEGAIEINTTGMTPEEVCDLMMGHIEGKLNA